ncbi:uncharacterized protein LOC122631869 isoform X1 [Vespula pensylvanica]|uniref:uncharacterized protein LOC127066775 n=2 Tax=Vespula TaxID=7451 RepID=UPI001CB9EC9B|nr:uncharacterized protein LOC122631869 isoform X1 [Vespula pensylvanica]XP_050856866.1 uncharacterized protein LOC127066775 [Vespula vulgaris]XP_050856867.1 uncharacterized protein LOC127066775 [Vespula vulgaris]XP_050856868.1 uncharacterized protein LOC127066775 [Vespula vulgaris]
MEPTRVPRGPGPRLVFLFATLVLTFAATGLLCGAIMTDHWEEVGWDKEALTHANVSLTWLDDQVAMLETPTAHRNHHRGRRGSFLVPMHGGIWTMCVSLSDDEIQLLGQVGFPQERCINYLTPDEAHEEIRAAWQNRMQNLSISCSLVCLIILGTAVLIGFFGLCRHQISAVLVTGVMYLLAATFALFTLTIIHFKRAQDRGIRIINGPEDGVIGGPVSRAILKARRFTTSWSMDFGWGGVTLCALASVAWILLSKIMRFSPIAAMIA